MKKYFLEEGRKTKRKVKYFKILREKMTEASALILLVAVASVRDKTQAHSIWRE